MRPEDILDNALNSVKNGINSVEDKYDNHIREKAIEKVNEKIKEKGLEILFRVYT